MPLNQSFSPVIECPICGATHKLANRTYGEIVRNCQDKLIRAKNRQELLADMGPEQKEKFFARQEEKEAELREIHTIELRRHEDRRRRYLGF